MRSTPSLGRIGLWTGRLQRMPMTAIREAAAEIDELGYDALWLPESPAGRDVLTYSAIVLGSTPRIPVATGIAIIWVRDPVAAASAARTIDEAYPGRFVLGLGVSHESTAVLRGHEYRTPMNAMESYLDVIATSPFDGPDREVPPVLVGALGPKMLRLSARKSAGAHPFLAPVAHTASAREILGDAYLAPELSVITTESAEAARSTARGFLERFLQWPNYRNHLTRLGYGDELDGGGSDRLVDDLFAWGSPDRIRSLVQGHLDAGADHVAVQPIPVEGGDWLDDARRLAPILLS